MTDIPVQQKRKGISWLGGILIGVGILVVILLIWWFAGSRDNPTGASTANPGSESGHDERPQDLRSIDASPTDIAANAGTIASLTEVLNAPDQKTLAGKSAELKQVKVQRVLGDRVFTLGEGKERELFAVLAKDLDFGRSESRIVVTSGLLMDLTGVIERPDAPTTEQTLGLRPSELRILRDKPIYLRVTKIGGMK